MRMMIAMIMMMVITRFCYNAMKYTFVIRWDEMFKPLNRTHEVRKTSMMNMVTMGGGKVVQMIIIEKYD